MAVSLSMSVQNPWDHISSQRRSTTRSSKMNTETGFNAKAKLDEDAKSVVSEGTEANEEAEVPTDIEEDPEEEVDQPLGKEFARQSHSVGKVKATSKIQEASRAPSADLNADAHPLSRAQQSEELAVAAGAAAKAVSDGETSFLYILWPLAKIGDWLCWSFTNTFIAATKYAISILVKLLNILQYPIAISLAFTVLSFSVYHAGDTVLSGFASVALGAVCGVPLVNMAPFCATRSFTLNGISPLQFQTLMTIQTDSLETLLEESVGLSTVGWDLKGAEIATGDLARLVRMSDLKSKEGLATHLEAVMTSAKVIARKLVSFDNLVQWATESTIAANDFALHTLEEKSNSFLSAVTFGCVDKLQSVSADAVNGSFYYALDMFTARMAEVLWKIEDLSAGLDDLDRTFEHVHTLVLRERITIIDERDKTLAALWTYLGGNRSKMRTMAGHLILLRGIAGYRMKAVYAIQNARTALISMDEAITHLRTRIGTDVGRHTLADMKMQLVSIRAGVARITEARKEAKLLSTGSREGALAHVNSPYDD